MRIGSNNLGLRIANDLRISSLAISRALNRLSTGSRVSSPKEDVASFSMASRIQTQVRGLRQSMLNINQYQGMLETASTALSRQIELVSEMRALANDAANGSASSIERENINKKIASLLEEFNKTTNETKFGELHLLRGDLSNFRFDLGGGSSTDLSLPSLSSQEIFSSSVGTGRFSPAQSSAIYTGTSYDLKSADLNNDGHQDLIYLRLGQSLNVQLGNGTGNFAAPITSATNTSATSFELADFNGDGILDIVTPDASPNTISLQIGYGDGSFATRVTTAASHAINGIASGDVDADGDIDIVGYSSSAGTQSVFINQGDGSFSVSATQSGVATIADIELADIDNDGDMDIVSASAGSPGSTEDTTITLNSGVADSYKGNYILLQLASGASHYFWFSVDGGGSDPGIFGATAHQVALNSVTDNTPTAIATKLRTAMSAVVGWTITAAGATTTVKNSSVGSVTDASTDDPTNISVTVTTQGAAAATGGVSAWLSNGDGTFGSSTTIVSTNLNTIRLGDINNDGILDLIRHTTASTSLVYHLGTGAGSFGSATTLTTSTGFTRFNLIDLNNDGLLDIVGTATNLVDVFLNQGGGSFATRTTYTAPASAGWITSGDFNEDGAIDLALGRSISTNINILSGIATDRAMLPAFNIQSVEDALNLIEVLDAGAEALLNAQSKLSTASLRLERVYDSKEKLTESLEDSYQDIASVDHALEVAELTRMQILQNAQIAALTQSNLQAQVVLRLLDFGET